MAKRKEAGRPASEAVKTRLCAVSFWCLLFCFLVSSSQLSPGDVQTETGSYHGVPANDMEQIGDQTPPPWPPDSARFAHALPWPGIYIESQHLCIYLLFLKYQLFILNDIIITLSRLLHQSLNWAKRQCAPGCKGEIIFNYAPVFSFFFFFRQGFHV